MKRPIFSTFLLVGFLLKSLTKLIFLGSFLFLSACSFSAQVKDKNSSSDGSGGGRGGGGSGGGGGCSGGLCPDDSGGGGGGATPPTYFTQKIFGGKELARLGIISSSSVPSGGSNYLTEIEYNPSYHAKVFAMGYTTGQMDLSKAHAGENDIVILRINTDGTIEKAYQVGGALTDSEGGVTLTASHVYYCGATRDSLFATNAGDKDIIFGKLDHNLNVVFEKQLGTAAEDYCKDIVVDSSGHIYLIGYTGGNLFETNAGGLDAFIAKMDSSGNLAQGKQFGSSSGGTAYDDFFVQAKISSLNEIVAVGYSLGSLVGSNSMAGTNADAILFKIDSSLNTVFSKKFGLGQTDEFSTVLIHESDNLILAGGFSRSAVMESTKGNDDPLIIAYDLDDGDERWVRQFGATTNIATSTNRDRVLALTVDGSSIYFAGRTEGTVNETVAGANDFLIGKMALDNSAVNWGVQLGQTSQPNTTEDRAYGIIPVSGGVRVFGFVTGDANEDDDGTVDIMSAKIDSNGVLVDQKQHGFESGGLNASGEENIAFYQYDSEGNLYIAGSTYSNLFEKNAGGEDIFFLKLDKDKNLVYAKQLGVTSGGSSGDDYIEQGIILNDGSWILIGNAHGAMLGNSYLGNRDIIIFKVNPQGQVTHSRVLGGVDMDTVTDMETDANGNVYICGSTSSDWFDSNQNQDVVALKLDADFNDVWGLQLGIASAPNAIQYDRANACVLDSSNNLYLGIETNSDLFEDNARSDQTTRDIALAKIDTNGNLLASKQFGAISGGVSQMDYLRGLELLGNDHLVFSFYSSGQLFGATHAGSTNDSGLVKINLSDLSTAASFKYGADFADSIGDEYARSIAVDNENNVYIAGTTNSQLNGAILTGTDDMYIMKVDEDMNFLGIKQFGQADFNVTSVQTLTRFGLTIDPLGQIAIVGQTQGPLFGDHGGTGDGSDTSEAKQDGFVFKVNKDTLSLVAP